MNDKRNIYNRIGTRVSVLLLALLVVSCSDTDEALLPVSSSTVPVDLLLQVSSAHDGSSTRSSKVLTQNDGGYRGISRIKMIPFASDQTPLASFDYDIDNASSYTATNSRHYLSQNQNLQLGTASFLCYGWPQSSAVNMQLTSDIDEDNPLNSTFSPTAIVDNASASKATILSYLNAIATAGGWNNATGELGTMFDEFVNKEGAIYNPFAGSSKNITKLVLELKDKFNNSVADGDVKTAVLSKIDEGLSVTYPVNLPDGSAVIQWNNSTNKFEYASVSNTYAYPLDLCYFTNSGIKTSDLSQQSSYADNKTWDAILGDYSTGDVVSTSTRSVAITEPLRYGVGCLKVTIKADLNGFSGLRDNRNDPNYLFPLTNSSNDNKPSFPLTAIMIGGQNVQGYDLTPQNPHEVEGEPEFVIYDPNIKDDGVSLSAEVSAPVYSLAFQTKGDKAVKLVLEFENKSGQSFESKSGIIYPDTKFYMVASIVPQIGTEDYYQRVFTRQYITTANLTIGSLANAYNALPNLNSDKIRLFTVVAAGVKDWQEGWEDTHEAYNW